jgi:hypothetical protein
MIFVAAMFVMTLVGLALYLYMSCALSSAGTTGHSFR